MKKKTQFGMEDIPYDILEEHGLSQQMVDDLPEEVIKKLLDGERTPLLPVIIKGVEGKAKISLVNTEDGMDVMVMPYFSKAKLDEFNDIQRDALLAGDAILTSLDGEDVYMQLDNETNQIVSCSKSSILHNIEVLEQQEGIDQDTANALKGGSKATFSKDGGTLTFKIDLNEDTGIRTAKGEFIAKEKKEDKLPHYSFGIYGCWVNNDSGILSYVNEEDYTQEMINAQEHLAENVKHGMSR